MNFKYSLIVGATSGLGRALSISLARNNKNLILIGKSRDKLNQLHREISVISSVMVLTEIVDLSVAENVQATILNSSLPLNVEIEEIFYCAAIKYEGPSIEIDIKKLQAMMSVNYFSAVAIVKSFINNMPPSGDIFLVTSGAANFGAANDGAYSATKAALERFSEALRVELMVKNINVTLISPGPMATSLGNVINLFSGRTKIPSNVNSVDPSVIARKILLIKSRKIRRMNLVQSTKIIRFIALFFPSFLELLISKKK
jgi:short-subunit dehydrogenase